jgi:integrase
MASRRECSGTSSVAPRPTPTSRNSRHTISAARARLCHLSGGELDQIQFLLGHVSIQTTEGYLGCKQKLRHAVNDIMGLEADIVG